MGGWAEAVRCALGTHLGEMTRTAFASETYTLPDPSTVIALSALKTAPEDTPSIAAPAGAVHTPGTPANAVTMHPNAGEGEGSGGGDVEGVIDGDAPGESVGVDVGVGEALGQVMSRTFELSWSVTTTPPPGSTATPAGPRKLATGPGPSSAPSAAEPATVDTLPLGVTYRSDEASTTYTPPSTSTAIPEALLKAAAKP